MFTDLPIERHACHVYTRSIFREVQKEIRKGLHDCYQISVTSEDGMKVCAIQQKNKNNESVINAKVVLNGVDGSVTCSCNHFGRHGYLCRHIFCVFRINSVNQIPDMYVSKRWTKDVLPNHLLEKRHRYGPCIEETDKLADDIHASIEYCIDRIRNDAEKLTELLEKVNELKRNLDAELPIEKRKTNNEEEFQKLLGVTTPKQVIVKAPQGIRNKGCGTGGSRFIGPGEKAKSKSKTNKTSRTCSICNETGHNMRTCKKNTSKAKGIVDEDFGDEDEGSENHSSDNGSSDN
ncbi:FAR1 DNA binding domain, Zinc finger, SWIM-type, MULE transposase domain, FHY3/FAR1 family [Artemisia annua]|uniref:FAR1 DNA binding domain, Zinc finger, SWIM-type, MULE transposase domain, FHY3/FAR1 family n=1 Tax=Artemisia annua TaxID=35608 RepID=A0A2U1LUF8_ARTAN|nr:FAR1 DNA binding domain, Zinc finger, SWIM-type, MULE transposase domain, FHY3/FAR1 family [Artemisia annua]